MQVDTSQGGKVLPLKQVPAYLRPPAGSVEHRGEARRAVLPLQPSAQQKEQEEEERGAAALVSLWHPSWAIWRGDHPLGKVG